MPSLHSSPVDDLVRPRSNTVNTTNGDCLGIGNTHSGKKNRQNLVLSTSFISTQRLDNNAPESPASPLQARRPRTSVSKALLAIRNEIGELQQQLVQARKNKEDTERIRDSTPSEIYKGIYSTDHLHKHSMRIRANSQIREQDKTIRKLERQIADRKQQYEQAKGAKELSVRNSDRLQVEPTFSASTGQWGKSQDDLDERSALDEDRKLVGTDTLTGEEGEDEDEDDVVFEHVNEPDEQTPSDGDASPLPKRGAGEVSNTSHIETATWLVSDYMQSLQDTNLTPEFVVKKANGLVSLLKDQPEIRTNLVLSSFMSSLQNLLLCDSKTIASAAYRVCRYLINDVSFIEWLLLLRLDSFIVISLAKDNSYQVEREQALKLVRAFLDYGAEIPKGIVQAIISCVEKQDDSLRHMALETLLEMCFIDPDVVNKCDGMRVLEGILREYSLFPLASIILDTVFELMSVNATRKYFLGDFNISVLTSVFSDTNTKDSLNLERMQNASVLISKALKDYNGLMLFSMDNFKPLKELLSFFQVPFCAQFLVDIFLDVLRIKKIPYKGSKGPFKLVASHFAHESMLLNQHVALLVLIMYQGGFIDQIGKLISRYENDNSSSILISKVRYLLSEYLNLAMNLLTTDISFANKVTPAWKVSQYNEAFEFGKISYSMNKHRNTLGMTGIDYGKNVREFSQSMKGKAMGREVDDAKFRKMVYDSRVLQTKDFSKWNWNLIMELVEGPLLNVKQLDELVKSTKFIRRLLIFYRPLRLRFSAIDKGARLSQRYIQVGCEFFRMLTSTSVGLKILMDDTKIISQLALLLYRAMDGHTSGNIINDYTLDKKLVSGYFKFIGVLTQSSNGIQVLKRWNFFTVFYKMFQADSPISVRFLQLTLPELDLKYSGHCKTIVGKALVIPNEEIRIKATENLGEKLMELSKFNRNIDDVGMIDERTNLQRYVMDMLTRQLYDLSPKVVAAADQSLYDCMMVDECSQEIISSLKTSLKQMVFIRSPLLFELLGTPHGFQLLNEINFIEAERKSWLESKNKEYVLLAEDFLTANQYTTFHARSREIGQNERLPQHFYGSLAKTEDGIALIGKSGDLLYFINTIKRYTNDLNTQTFENGDEILELKSAIWCVGYIGSTELGVGLLDNYELVEELTQIAYGASETMVRFTAFSALGLLSKTLEGCEILDETGWTCCCNVQGTPIGISLPKRLDKLLSFSEKPWSMQGEYKEEMIEFDSRHGELVGEVQPIKLNLELLLTEKNKIENPLDDDTYAGDSIREAEHYFTAEQAGTISKNYETEEEKVLDEILETVSQLGNHILSNNAINGITEMNNKYGPKLFESEIIFLKIMDMMAKYRFKPHVRKFLCDLFINKKALENVIRRDRKRN